MVKKRGEIQMIVECPANMRLQDYLLSKGIHLLTAFGGW